MSLPLWVFAELAIIATDLAEVIGTAIGLNLLFGIPLEIGIFITALDVFPDPLAAEPWLPLDRGLHHRALGVIAACFFVQIAMADPDWVRSSAASRRRPKS